jgi:hypothetical protein
MACEWISTVPHLTPARRQSSFEGGSSFDSSVGATFSAVERRADDCELVAVTSLPLSVRIESGTTLSSVTWWRRPRFNASALGVLVSAVLGGTRLLERR